MEVTASQLPAGSRAAVEAKLWSAGDRCWWMYENDFMHRTTNRQPAVCPIAKPEIHRRGCLGFEVASFEAVAHLGTRKD